MRENYARAQASVRETVKWSSSPTGTDVSKIFVHDLRHTRPRLKAQMQVGPKSSRQTDRQEDLRFGWQGLGSIVSIYTSCIVSSNHRHEATAGGDPEQKA